LHSLVIEAQTVIQTVLKQKKDFDINIEKEIKLKIENDNLYKKEEYKKSQNIIVDSHKVAIGDILLYEKDNNVNVNSQLVKIVSIHRDDYPNLYFTITYDSSSSGTETGTGIQIEKQTTAKYLKYPTSNEVPSEFGGFSILIQFNSKSNIRLSGIGK
jgi:hypothetical protein